MTKIAVIGEAFTDRYWLGTTNRLSAEAPIPVVKVAGQLNLFGGAANVAENVRSLGADALEVFQVDSNPVKNRLMVGDHQLARWDQNDEGLKGSTIFPWLGDCHGVIISDYGKGMFSPEFIQGMARDVQGKPVFIDTKHDPFLFTPLANAQTFYFPNLAEYRQFRTSYEDLDNVVLKRGAEGLQLGEQWVPARARKVVSVNGAGDTVIAAFAVYYLLSKDTGLALEAAGRAAGLACEQPYTTAVKKEWMVYGSEPVL